MIQPMLKEVIMVHGYKSRYFHEELMETSQTDTRLNFKTTSHMTEYMYDGEVQIFLADPINFERD